MSKLYGLWHNGDGPVILMTSWSETWCYLWYIDNVLLPFKNDHDINDVDIEDIKESCKNGKIPDVLKHFMNEYWIRYEVIELPTPQ